MRTRAECGARSAEKGENRLCACGCKRNVPKGRNRNKVERRFFSDECRVAYDRRVRKAGREVLELRPARRKRQEHVDLDRMRPQERLGALARMAEKMGVI